MHRRRLSVLLVLFVGCGSVLAYKQQATQVMQRSPHARPALTLQAACQRPLDVGRDLRFVEQAPPAAAVDPPADCTHGKRVNDSCVCDAGWAGRRCAVRVVLPPPTPVAVELPVPPTADYELTLDDRWACPGGCSAHGACNMDTRVCSCEAHWFGDACEMVHTFAKRSRRTLMEPDREQVLATVLPPTAVASSKQQRALDFVASVRHRQAVLEDALERAAGNTAASTELSGLRDTVEMVGGSRWVGEAAVDARRAREEEAHKRQEEEAAKRTAAQRKAAVEQAVEHVVRHSLEHGHASGEAPVKLGDFKLFKRVADAPAKTADDMERAEQVMRSAELGQVHETEVQGQ